MSRYIRTKDGKVFDIHEYWSSKAFEIEPNEDYWVDEMLRRKGIDKKDCKVVSTIEELCTDIIVKNYEEQYPSTSPIGVSISWKAYQPIVEDVEGIYGAIWVKGEKGEPILKSVAKMNDKGELELL